MGLFGLGKKKEEEKTATTVEATNAHADPNEIKTCEKCGKEFKMSEGNMVLGGSAFCCLACCPKEEGKADDGTCEFC